MRCSPVVDVLPSAIHTVLRSLMSTLIGSGASRMPAIERFHLTFTYRVALARVSVLVSLLLSACISGPPPIRYLLEPSITVDSQPDTPVLSSLGLATVVVPGYVKANSIALRGEGAKLVLDEGSHWAEDPDAALTRTLAESLRLHSGADVLVEPLPRGFDPQARIEVVIDRLLAQPGGIADVAGQLRLISGDGRQLIVVLPFRLLQRGRGDDYDGFFDALSVSMDDLARLVIKALLREPS